LGGVFAAVARIVASFRRTAAVYLPKFELPDSCFIHSGRLEMYSQNALCYDPESKGVQHAPLKLADETNSSDTRLPDASTRLAGSAVAGAVVTGTLGPTGPTGALFLVFERELLMELVCPPATLSNSSMDSSDVCFSSFLLILFFL